MDKETKSLVEAVGDLLVSYKAQDDSGVWDIEVYDEVVILRKAFKEWAEKQWPDLDELNPSSQTSRYRSRLMTNSVSAYDLVRFLETCPEGMIVVYDRPALVSDEITYSDMVSRAREWCIDNPIDVDYCDE